MSDFSLETESGSRFSFTQVELGLLVTDKTTLVLTLGDRKGGCSL